MRVSPSWWKKKKEKKKLPYKTRKGERLLKLHKSGERLNNELSQRTPKFNQPQGQIRAVPLAAVYYADETHQRVHCSWLSARVYEYCSDVAQVMNGPSGSSSPFLISFFFLSFFSGISAH